MSKPYPEVGGHASGDATIHDLPPLPDALVQRAPAEGAVVPVPVEARIAAKALRTAAYWLPDDHRATLLGAADGAERHWDGACCPVCEEVWCDTGCPLGEVRAKLMKEAHR